MATAHAKPAHQPERAVSGNRLKDLIAEFYVDAMAFTSQSKVEETAHQWLARAYFDSADPSSAGILALALMFAIDIALFTPSLSGSTAIDRLARQRKAADETEKAALTALKQSSFQILRIRSAADPHGLVPFENGATGKRHPVACVQQQDLPECRQHWFLGCITETKKIKVPRPSVGIIEPAHHQHSAFQYETLGVARLAEPEQQPFQGKASQDEIEALAFRFRQLQQAGPY